MRKSKPDADKKTHLKYVDKSKNISLSLSTIKLPKPKFGSSASVFSALLKRESIRTISNKKLSLQLLSNILWAGWGVNREKGPFGTLGRTAGSASNSQEIDLYAILPEGIFLYEAQSHSLLPTLAGDYRSLAIGKGQSEWGSKTPARFIYVVNIDKFKTAGFQEPGLSDPEIQKSYYFVDTGLIAGNVYIAAASLGLAAWFHNCNKPALTALLKLPRTQRPLFGQTIGYAEKG